MPNLRQIIDGMAFAGTGIAPMAPVAPSAPPPGNAMPTKGKKSNGKGGKGTPSPMAKHISNHMQDPVGATKDQFGQLQQKKMEYDMQREEMQRNLGPVQSVINHISQMHNLQPDSGINPLGTTVDPMTGQPISGPGQPSAPGLSDPAQGYDEDGNPANMNQTVGKMNSTRPSLVGHQPGVAPGDGQTVRPGKMGVPQPGQGNAGTTSGVPRPGPSNKVAAKPKGNPGGPGSSKVASRTKKAQDTSSRQIKVHVSAAAAIPVIKASRTIETQFGLARLHGLTIGAAGTSKGAKKQWSTRGKGHLSRTEKEEMYETMDSAGMMPSGGMPRSSMPRANPIMGRPISAPVRGPMTPAGGQGGGGSKLRMPTGRMFSKKAKKMKAGPEALRDKVDDSEDQLAINPVVRGGKCMKDCECAKCKGMNAGGPGSGRHKWTVSKATGEHLYKGQAWGRGYSAGTFGRISPPYKEGGTFSVKTFGPRGFDKQANSLEEAKRMVEEHMANK